MNDKKKLITSTVILDSSALLAYLQQEDGADVVVSAIKYSNISAINWSEVISKLQERGYTEELILDTAEILISAGLKIIPVSHEVATSAGLLRVPTKKWGLSLADRICLAYAKITGKLVITADQAWSNTASLLRIEIALIR